MGVTVRVVPRVTQNDGGRSIEVSFMPYRPGLTGEPSGLKRVTAIVSVVISRSSDASSVAMRRLLALQLSEYRSDRRAL